MEIIPYNQLNVTTMTLIALLTNNINIELAFQLLPITIIDNFNGSVKYKLPHCNVPGSILSMRYKNRIRGVSRNRSDPFKNSVTIDMSIAKKNISLKLSPFSVQICGASSKQDGVEAINYLLKHLLDIQSMLDYIQSNYKKFTEAVNWIKNSTCGSSTKRIYCNIKHYKNINFRVYHEFTDFFLVLPRKIPKNLDKHIVEFLFKVCNDLIYYSDLCKKIEFISNVNKIINKPLEIKSIDEAMVNYNYSLGFEINRSVLDRLIDGKNGFTSRYNNALTTNVTIELPYEPFNNSIKHKKNKIPHHTFLVYKSGAVTQSGPGGKLMEEAYYLFMKTIHELKPFIEYNP